MKLKPPLGCFALTGLPTAVLSLKIDSAMLPRCACVEYDGLFSVGGGIASGLNSDDGGLRVKIEFL